MEWVRSKRGMVLWGLLVLLGASAAALHHRRGSVTEGVPEVPAAAIREACGPLVVPEGARDLPSFLPMEVTSPAEVREVVRVTRRAGAGDIPALEVAALTSEDSLVVSHALRALGRLGAVVGHPGLVALAHDPRNRVQQELVRALGLSGDPTVVFMLEDLLGGARREVRPLVIQALGRIGGLRASELLSAILNGQEASDLERVFASAALREARSPTRGR